MRNAPEAEKRLLSSREELRGLIQQDRFAGASRPRHCFLRAQHELMICQFGIYMGSAIPPYGKGGSNYTTSRSRGAHMYTDGRKNLGLQKFKWSVW